jgi:hypothetical protein
MKPAHNATTHIAVELSHDELMLINNALNEVVNGIHFGDDEFATRLGNSRAEAEKLLAKMGKLLGKK